MANTIIVAFNGGTNAVAAIGQRSKFRFFNTWADGETWTISLTSTLQGDYTFGVGNISGQVFSCIGKLKDRLFLGFGDNFALGGIGDPTGWEVQNAGAGVINYTSQYGIEDSVTAFASLQGRLAVFGTRSVQMWTTDANPASFALEQVLDNTGTRDPLSVQNIGDYDTIFLDQSGIRSLRAKEVTLNAYVNDMGTAIDALVRQDLSEYTPGTACGIVEPSTRQYWLFLNGVIYVLSYYPQSKVAAWSTFDPSYADTSSMTPSTATYGNPSGQTAWTVNPGGHYYWVKAGSATTLTDKNGNVIRRDTGGFEAPDASDLNDFGVVENGTPGATVSSTMFRVDNPFSPQKFVVYSDQVYLRASNGKIYLYGGTNNATYDRCGAIAELPWLTLGTSGSIVKQLQGFDMAISGRWEVFVKSNPKLADYTRVTYRGSDSSPNVEADSTYDIGHVGCSGSGTHMKFLFTSYDNASAKVSKFTVLFSDGNVK